MDRDELRRAILSADDLPTETVDVPEWGQKVIVRGLTAAEKDAYSAEVMDMQSGSLTWRNASALLAVRTMVTESGERVFADADAKALGDKSASAMSRLFDVAIRLSGLSRTDVEELVSDFEPAQSDASSTS